MEDSLFKHNDNVLIGGGSAVASGALAWFLLKSGAKRRKAKGLPSMTATGRMLASLGIGAGVGLLASALAYGKDVYNGKSLHPERQIAALQGEYGNLPDRLTYYVAGAGSVPGRFDDVHRQYGDAVVLVNPYNDMQRAKEQIKRLADRGFKIRLDFAGHSKGGQKAKELADYASGLGLDVGKLDTIDPIYWYSRAMELGKRGDYEWTNYYTTKANWKYISDLWAMLGGRHAANSHADNNVAIDIPLYNNHGYANEYPAIGGRKQDEHEWKLPNPADVPGNHWTNDVLGTVKSILGR